MDELKVIKTWNEFVECLVRARKLWEEVKEEYGGVAQIDFDRIPPKIAKVLSIYRRAKFEVMLPRFIAFWRTQGGLDQMLADIPEQRTMWDAEEVLRGEEGEKEEEEREEEEEKEEEKEEEEEENS